MGVRVDQEGYLTKDFQTAQNVAKASDSGTEDLISNRYYLSDASFLIGLEGDDAKWLRHLHSALATPVWMLFLGRKSYVPSLPLYLPDGFIEDSDLRSALLNYPLLFRSKQQKNIRIILESSSVTHESRMDTPVSFAHGRREFRERFVKMEFLPAETLAFEGGYLCI
jgi:CRISPR system Cascade subunit CasD